ncbi:hypothetical protein TNCT_95731 [Trichonephila clavata]|uniref:Uncharacterized protein n=1 Tax=Trichonephila clavata TaxID=2740835 RepID=A0A8X6JA55_TRICU|nr:hypothetical protein TNCT_95731 [Trichonephila clavata]
MTTESFRKGRFAVATLTDDELPEGFLETSVRCPPRAGSEKQTQPPSSELQFHSVNSPSGSSSQEVADTLAPTFNSSVESSTEYCYVEPIIHVIHPAGIQISLSSGDVPSENVPEQPFIDNGAKQQATTFLEELGCFEESDDYSPSMHVRRKSESGKFEEISPDAVEASATNESTTPLLGESEQQSTVCFGRCGESYVNFVKEFRNSTTWLVFLCVLLIPTASGIVMGLLYPDACTKPFNISKLSVVNGILGLLGVVCHIATIATRRFAPSLKIPLFKVISIIAIVMLAVLLFIEFVSLPIVDPSDSCWIMYYYMLYMNIAYVVIMIAVTIFHLDLLYYMCCPQYNCMSSAQTED